LYHNFAFELAKISWNEVRTTSEVRLGDPIGVRLGDFHHGKKLPPTLTPPPPSWPLPPRCNRAFAATAVPFVSIVIVVAVIIVVSVLLVDC
jgi:hypothetical protein